MRTVKSIFLFSILSFNFHFISAQSLTTTGSAEFGGDFSFSFQKTSGEANLSFSTFSFKAYAGMMVLPGFEMGLSPAVSGYSASDFSLTQFSIYLMPSYNFNLKSNVYPYLELLAGFGLADDESNPATISGLGGDAGIKVKLKENGLLLVKVEYLRQFFKYLDESDKYHNVPKDFNFDAITFGVGFRFLIIHQQKKQ